MKVENRGLIPLEIRNLENKKISKEEIDQVNESSLDRHDIELSQRLRETIEAIAESGLTAGEFHSGLDENRVQGLLYSLEIESKRPRISDEALLNLTDRVSRDLLADAQKAQSLFKDLSGARVAELLNS